MEENKSADFLSKLNKMTQKNKESKHRTKVNSHKLEWFKKFRSMQSRESLLEEELKQFMLSNQSIIKERKREQSESESISRQSSFLSPIKEAQDEEAEIPVEMQSFSSKIQVDSSLLDGPFDQYLKRQEFQKELFSNVGAIKKCVTYLNEDIKQLKMPRFAGEKGKDVKQRFHQNQTEVRALIREVKGSMD